MSFFSGEKSAKVAQLCPALCDSMGFTIHGILQGRIMEWVAFLISRGSFQPRDWTQVSCIAGGFFTSWATREAPYFLESYVNYQTRKDYFHLKKMETNPFFSLLGEFFGGKAFINNRKTTSSLLSVRRWN